MSHPLADPDQLRPYTTTADPVEAYFVVESDKYSSKTFIRRRLGAKLISIPNAIFRRVRKTRRFSSFLLGVDFAKTKYSDSEN